MIVIAYRLAGNEIGWNKLMWTVDTHVYALDPNFLSYFLYEQVSCTALCSYALLLYAMPHLPFPFCNAEDIVKLESSSPEQGGGWVARLIRRSSLSSFPGPLNPLLGVFCGDETKLGLLARLLSS